MPFEVGQRAGDYQVIDVLGVGGMGQVYKVQNVISKRVEAMKVLLPNLEGNPQLADRFMQEIEVQARLEHPNIAALRTAQRVDNQLVMVMEFVEGTSIDALLKRGSIPVDKALDYTIQILGALAYAHGHGIVHRDIKPANMMLTAGGTVKLLDFGIAKLVDRNLTQTGHTLGSLFYMSPEQINDPQNLDSRSDLYSVGISLYEMVTGQRPFRGDSDYSIMLGHLTQQPQPPIQVDPSLPPALNDVVLMAIAKEKEARFQSAEAFRRALEAVRAELGTATIPFTAAAAGSAAVAGSAAGATPAPAYVQPPRAEAQPAAAPPPVRRESKRGLYIALGSVVTVLVLAVAAWQIPRFAGSKADTRTAVPSSQQSVVPAPAAQPASPAAVEQPSVQPPAEPQVQPQETKSAAETTSAPPAVPERRSPQATDSVRVPTGRVQDSVGRRAQALPVQPQPEPSQPRMQSPAAVPSTPVPAAAPQVDNAAAKAAVREARQQLMMLGTRARSLNQGLESLRRQQGGLGLRGDMVTAQQRMELQLDEAEASIKDGDVEAAKRSLAAAEREVERLEKFLGR